MSLAYLVYPIFLVEEFIRNMGGKYPPSSFSALAVQNLSEFLLNESSSELIAKLLDSTKPARHSELSPEDVRNTLYRFRLILAGLQFDGEYTGPFSTESKTFNWFCKFIKQLRLHAQTQRSFNLFQSG